MTEQHPEGGDGLDASVTGELVGSVLGGRYRILRKLGEGSMGAVYVGEHLRIGRQDAIKVLREGLATDPETVRRFVRGTRNVSLIRHPNVCTIYDFSDSEAGVQFVAMELVPGETLRDVLAREGKLSVEEAVHIAAQAADALAAAHAAGVVHRDLKPANIMVVPRPAGPPEVKVVDFDIAKGSGDGEGEEVTRMGLVVGTPEYMSPEQLIGEKLDGRSDIYSLALVLFRMLTGTLPFVARDTQELMVKRLTEDPLSLAEAAPSASFPPALGAALRRALQRRFHDRQKDAGEFADEIRAAAAALQDSSSSLTATSHLAYRGRSGRHDHRERRTQALVKVAAGLAALVLAATAGFFAFDAGSQGEQEPQLAVTELGGPTGGAIPAGPPPSANSAAESLAQAPHGDPEEVRDLPIQVAATSGGAAADPGRPPLPTSEELLEMLDVFPFTPDSATLMATLGSGAAVWRHPDATDMVRATGAYVAYEAALALGDRAQALVWIDRALKIRPYVDGYRTARAALIASQQAPP